MISFSRAVDKIKSARALADFPTRASSRRPAESPASPASFESRKISASSPSVPGSNHQIRLRSGNRIRGKSPPAHTHSRQGQRICSEGWRKICAGAIFRELIAALTDAHGHSQDLGGFISSNRRKALILHFHQRMKRCDLVSVRAH